MELRKIISKNSVTASEQIGGDSFRRIKSLCDILAEQRKEELYPVDGYQRSHSLDIVFEDSKGISNDYEIDIQNLDDEIPKGINSPTNIQGVKIDDENMS